MAAHSTRSVRIQCYPGVDDYDNSNCSRNDCNSSDDANDASDDCGSSQTSRLQNAVIVTGEEFKNCEI